MRGGKRLRQRGMGWVTVWAVFPWVMALPAVAQGNPASAAKAEKVVVTGAPAAPAPIPPADSTTEGTVTVGGQLIAYKAVAGTITVGSTDTQDATLDFEGKLLPDSGVKPPDKDKPEEEQATARIF